MTGRTAARATEAQQQYVRAVEKATKEVPAYLSEIGELDKKGRMLQDTMDKQIQLMFEKLKSNTLDAAEHARIQAEVQQNCATYVGDQQTKVDRSRKLYESVSNQVTTIDQEIVKLEKEIAEIQGKVQTGHNSVAAAASSRGIGRGGRKAGRTAVQPMEEMPLQPPPLVPPVVPIPAIPAHFVPFTFHFPGRPAFTEYVDPHEPRYCVCKQPSQGDMIACDNNTCKIEWFHNVCVGITKAPDKWICPECRKSDGMQKRGRRQ